MRALVGYACLFIAVGIILSCFMSGVFEFLVTVAFLVLAYVLLCMCD